MFLNHNNLYFEWQKINEMSLFQSGSGSLRPQILWMMMFSFIECQVVNGVPVPLKPFPKVTCLWTPIWTYHHVFPWWEVEVSNFTIDPILISFKQSIGHWYYIFKDIKRNWLILRDKRSKGNWYSSYKASISPCFWKVFEWWCFLDTHI